MKSLASEIKRKINRETACVNFTLVGVTAAAFALICIINSIANVKSAAYKNVTFPSFAPSPFLCVLLWVLMSALFGAALAVVISTPTPEKNKKKYAVVTAAAAFVLCSAWIPLFYSAKSFLIAAFVAAVLSALSAILFSLYSRISRLAAVMDAVFAAWTVYVLLFSLATAFSQ
ncbi:MAG: tryptophan-rich sensory protein [Clostridia bacterium]|nr:tryptophan-rich sensory protein [Clostridia bacterium]